MQKMISDPSICKNYHEGGGGGIGDGRNKGGKEESKWGGSVWKKNVENFKYILSMPRTS
jgi:hypothetical protein